MWNLDKTTARKNDRSVKEGDRFQRESLGKGE
jgi:hypothetical protein